MSEINGEVLKSLRKRKELTQAAAAEAAGMTAPHLSKLETNRAAPTICTLAALLGVYGFHLSISAVKEGRHGTETLNLLVDRSSVRDP